MRLEWGALMRLGMGRLALSPAVFWALTPAELLLMAGLDKTPPPMSRDVLENLARLYPDERKNDGEY